MGDLRGVALANLAVERDQLCVHAGQHALPFGLGAGAAVVEMAGQVAGLVTQRGKTRAKGHKALGLGAVELGAGCGAFGVERLHPRGQRRHRLALVGGQRLVKRGRTCFQPLQPRGGEAVKLAQLRFHRGDKRLHLLAQGGHLPLIGKAIFVDLGQPRDHVREVALRHAPGVADHIGDIARRGDDDGRLFAHPRHVLKSSRADRAQRIDLLGVLANHPGQGLRMLGQPFGCDAAQRIQIARLP